MNRTVHQVLRGAELYSDGRPYRVVKLPPNAITLAAGVMAEAGLPFCAMIVDKDEVTLVMPEEARKACDARLRRAEVSDREYRLITFEAVLDPGLVGFIARIAEALAAVDIPLLTFAAYSRDHIFVPADDFDKALDALRGLRAESV